MTKKSASFLMVQLQDAIGDWIDVGYLINHDGKNWFEFTETYWDLPHRPILGQIFEERGREWKPSARTALPNWFSHLLPEGRLRQAVAQAAHFDRKYEFELIKKLGETDLPGALRMFEVDGKEFKHPERGNDASDSNGKDPILKFSLAGAQLKFSVFKGEKGISVPVRGQAGNYILKLPDQRIGFRGVPEAEFASLRFASQCGIRAADVEFGLLGSVSGLEEWNSKFDQKRCLLVKRFDRVNSRQRIHMEELAQIVNTPPNVEMAKYDRGNNETIAVLVEALCGTEAVGEVIDRIVFNILIGNGDAHLKNWAVTYDVNNQPELSPTYDVVPTVFYMKGDDLGLNLSRSKDFKSISLRNFHRIGRKTHFGEGEAENRANLMVERVLDNWALLGEMMPGDIYNFLTVRLRELRIAEGFR
ncbi:type II toxin-antitoxin system HipA family toxin [Nocardiopsis alba]|uniref:type II toxin-antitoxin system HipA family toxin n=1 Tax=Nocardiopsis alba TaxID=53437 RepID=UPI00365833F3